MGKASGVVASRDSVYLRLGSTLFRLRERVASLSEPGESIGRETHLSR
jgi:hypothetical protein